MYNLIELLRINQIVIIYIYITVEIRRVCSLIDNTNKVQCVYLQFVANI